MTTCRMCHEHEYDEKMMVRYGPRHQAHWQCFFNKRGVEGWARLNAWQVSRTPLWLFRNNPELRAVVCK